MSKIFRYECRRLLWNKFFIGLAVVLLLYGALVLHAVTILGVSHTAPFSPWSFGDYLSRMLPLLWIGMLFFLTFYTSPKARRAATLTDAAPMPPRKYALARCAAALTGGVLLSLLCIGEAAVFYGRMFGWYGWGSLLLPALATLLPALVFALGSGWLLGQIRLPADGPAPAGGPLPLERPLLHRLSPDPGDPGPGLCSAHRRGCGAGRPAGPWGGAAGSRRQSPQGYEIKEQRGEGGAADHRSHHHSGRGSGWQYVPGHHGRAPGQASGSY